MITVKKDKIWKDFIQEIGKLGDMTLKYHKGEMLFFLFLINLKVKDDRIKSLQEFYIKYILLSFKGLLLFEKIGEWFAQERSIPTKPRFRSVPDVTVLNSQPRFLRNCSLSADVFQGVSFGIASFLC